MGCKDCGKPVTKGYTRCRKDAAILRTMQGSNNHLIGSGRDNPNYKHGRHTKRLCSVCGASLSVGGGKGNLTGKFRNCYHKSIEWRRAISERVKVWVAKGTHHFGDGTKTPENKAARMTLEYREWRRSVFDRDDYTCQQCGQRGGKLQADHIKPFSLFPHLRLVLSNGRTLCVGCHKKTDTYLHKAKNYQLAN